MFNVLHCCELRGKVKFLKVDLRSEIKFTALGGLGLGSDDMGSEIQFTALDYERICEGRESGRELVGQVVHQVLNKYDRYEPRPTVHNMTVG